MVNEFKIKIKIQNPQSFSFLFCVTFLLYANSGFYFSSFPILSPVYIFFYFILLIIVFLFLKKTTQKITLQSVIGLILVFYILISQTLVQGKPIALLGSAATFLFYIFGTLLLPKFSFSKVLIIANGMLLISLILGLIDTIYRLNLVNFNIYNLLLNFYEIKKQCLFYADTNSLAINTTILTFFSIYLYNLLKYKKYIFFAGAFFIITLLSCSRSAMFATLITFFILYGFKIIIYLIKSKNSIFDIAKLPTKKMLYYTILILTSIIFILVLYKILLFLATDGSFSTKLNLLEALINFIQNAPLINLLLGTGYNNGGISLYSDLDYAHSYLATYVIETGFFGYLLVTSFLLSILYKTKKTIYLLIPFFIMGISHISHTQLHLFYTALVLIWFFEKKAYLRSKQ